MIKSILKILPILILFALQACNDDVFIEDSGIRDLSGRPSSARITLDGNGEEWTALFSRKGLKRICVDHMSGSMDLVYYGADGIVDKDCPPSDLEAILYDTPLRYFSINFSEKMIYIRCYFNTLSETSFTLALEYDDGKKTSIDVTITPGEPYRFIMDVLSGSEIIEENVEQMTHRTIFANNTSISQKLEVYPYRDSYCSDVVIPADEWAEGIVLNDMRMPTFSGKEWMWYHYDDICLGTTRTFAPELYDDEKFVVEVPANTVATVTYTLHYSRYIHEGYVMLYNPIDDHTIEEDVCWNSVYPVDYDYTVEFESVSE